jgi:hypothetical protein
MLSVSILALLHLIQLHGPDGQVIDINPSEVSSLREPRKTEDHFPKGTNCVVIMTNSRISLVVEDCEVIRSEIEGMK